MKSSISGAPFGFRFVPTDAELIDVLRRAVVEKRPLTPPHDRVIHSYNMFGTKSEPSEIWAAYGGPDLVCYSQGLYFFSEIKRVTPNGSYVVRKMGGGEGKWNGKLTAVRIDGDCGPIGQKRTFGYLNKSSEDNGGWLLDEYSIFACPRSGVGKTGYDYNTVLCRLRKKEGFAVKTNKYSKRKTLCDDDDDDDDRTVPVKKKMRTTDVQLEPELGNNEQLEVPQESASSGLSFGNAQFVGSDVSNEQLEGPREESTCGITSRGNADFVGSHMEHEMNKLMAVGDFEESDPSMCISLDDLDSIYEKQGTAAVESQELVHDVPQTQQVLPPLSSECGNIAAEEEEDRIYSLVDQLSAEHREEISEIQDEPLFKELMAEVQRERLTTASATFDADEGGLEEACNPSITFDSWIDSMDKDLERAV